MTAIADTPSALDRSAEADRVIDYLTQTGRHVAVLFGQRGSRRRELVRDWVIPRLNKIRETYYADCDPHVPALLGGPGNGLPVREALGRGAVVFFGRVERCLAILEPDDQRLLTDLLRALDRGELPGSLVLLIPDRSLAHMLSLQEAAPGLLTSLLEISVVTFRDALQRLAVSGAAECPSYDPEAIDALTAEVERSGAADAVELALAVHQGVRRFKSGSNPHVSLQDYKDIGGIAGALEQYRQFRLENAAQRWGAESREMADMILAEIASSSNQALPPALDDLPRRLGITESAFQNVLGWMCAEGALLRDDGTGRLEIVPEELSEVIQQEVARKQREIARARALLRDGSWSWSHLGDVLPAKRLEEIQAVREWLPASDEEAALMVRSLIERADADQTGSVYYWLNRIHSRNSQTSFLLKILFSESPAMRRWAAELLSGFEEADVLRQLHRVATEDPDQGVRQAALASLAKMQVADLWPVISREARQTQSPYQINAVTALRLFPEDGATALLRELVASGEQPFNVKAEAIQTLAALKTQTSVSALVDIALNDEYAKHRESAAAALTAIESREQACQAIEEIRDSKLKLERAGPMTVHSALLALLRLAAALIVAILNIFVHGTALLVLRRYRSGLVFLGIEALILLAQVFVFRASNGGWAVAFLLLALNYLVSELVATRRSLLQQRSAASRESPHAPPVNANRWSFGTALPAVLMCSNLPVFFCIHGLAHGLAGLPRRAIRLLGLECFGILCCGIGYFYFSGLATPITPFPPDVSHFLSFVYFGVGGLVLAGSFLSDVGPVLYGAALEWRRQYGWRCRMALYDALAQNRWAAEYLLDCAVTSAGRNTGWARRVVTHTVRLMPFDEVVRSLKTQYRRPSYLLQGLKRVKDASRLKTLAGEWGEATPRVRRWIVDVLAGKPNEASLEQLRALRKNLDGYGRVRYGIARWNYRLRVWPNTVLLVSVLLLPPSILAAWEAYKISSNPSRPVLRMVQTPQLRNSWSEERLLESLQFLARFGESSNELDKVFAESTQEDQGHHWSAKGLDSLAGTVCNMAGDDPQQQTDLNSGQVNLLRQRLVSVLILVLKSDSPDRAMGALSVIERDSDRCNMSSKSRAELVEAGSSLHKKATSKNERLAVAALSASGDPSAEPYLEEISRELTSSRGNPHESMASAAGGRLPSDDLPQQALNALSRNPSPKAALALDQIGNARETRPEFANEARRLASERYKQILADARLQLEGTEAKSGYQKLSTMLSLMHDASERQETLALLGRSAYQLSAGSLDSSPAESGEWATKAIEDFEKLRRSRKPAHLEPENQQMLATAYAIRADGYPNLRKDAKGALADAARAIKEDPSSAAGSGVMARLLQETGKPRESLSYALATVEKDPSAAWGYWLVRNAYLIQLRNTPADRTRLEEAVSQLEQLTRRHPDVIWPRRYLTAVYHDHLSAFDPRAFAQAYALFATIEKQFGPGLSHDQRLELDADFLENRFTTGHYQDVIHQARRLEQELDPKEYHLRIPVSLYHYAAFVMAGDTAGSEKQLSVLDALVRTLPPSYLDWRYSGTVNYLKTQPLDETQQKLIQLFTAADNLGTNKDLSKEIAANRAALQKMKLRASSAR